MISSFKFNNLLIHISNIFFNVIGNCEYAEWESWAQCDKTCGGGIQFRSRKILNHPWFGGVKCTKNALQEHQKCNKSTCH